MSGQGTLKNPINYELGHNGGSFSVRSLADAQEQLREEKARWHWLKKVAGNETHIKQLDDRVTSAFGTLEKYLETHLMSTKPARGLIQNYVDQVTRLYESGKLIHSRSIAGSIALDLADRFPDGWLATGFVAGCVGQSQVLRINRPEVNTGYSAGLLFTLDGTTLLDTAQQQFGKAAKSYIVRATKLKTVTEQQIEGFNSAKAEMDQSVSDHSDHWKDLFDKMRNDFDDIRSLYAEKMSLDGVVQYWETKAGKHKVARNSWGIASFVGFILVTIILLGYGGFALQEVVQFSNGELQTLDLSRIFMGVVISLVLFWGLRVILRNYLSEVHLKKAADSRAVLAKTYLALLKQDGLPLHEDRRTALETLFAALNDGIVSEDASPSLLSAIRQAVRN